VQRFKHLYYTFMNAVLLFTSLLRAVASRLFEKRKDPMFQLVVYTMIMEHIQDRCLNFPEVSASIQFVPEGRTRQHNTS
jgi:hypothetical protein